MFLSLYPIRRYISPIQIRITDNYHNYEIHEAKGHLQCQPSPLRVTTRSCICVRVSEQENGSQKASESDL
jgi:hypothetical protein